MKTPTNSRATRRRTWRADWRTYRVGPMEHGRPSRKVRRQAWREAWAEEFRATKREAAE